MKSPRAILLIKPSSIGDIIHSVPFFHSIRHTFPEAAIDWLVNDTYVNLVEKLPGLRTAIPFPRRKWGKLHRLPTTSVEFMRLVRSLRGAKYDLVIDLQCLFRSATLGWLSGAPARFGLAQGREWSPVFYTDRVTSPTDPMHAVDRYLCVAEALGCDITSPEFDLGLTSEEIETGKTRLLEALPDSGPIIGMGTGARWASKVWPLDRFATITQRLIRERNARIFFVGNDKDKSGIETILSRLSPEERQSVASFAGETTLRELASLLRGATLFLANDSGPMHMAAAMGTPVIALFGPSDPRRVYPYGQGHSVIAATTPNRGLHSRDFKSKDPHFMKQLSSDDVFNGLVEALQQMSVA